MFPLFMESVSQNMCTTILFCSLWSRYFTIVSFVHLELFFLWSGFRVGLCSWVWGVSTTLMWHLPFCRSDNLNVSVSISIASSAIFGLDTRNKKHNFCSVPPAGDLFLFSLVSRTKAFPFHGSFSYVRPLTWNTRSKETGQGDWGLLSNCEVSQLWADIFSRVGVCLSLSKPSWLGCQRQLFF